ncbi:hypothetical protein Tco_0872107 [Tanacetum coccineum]
MEGIFSFDLGSFAKEKKGFYTLLFSSGVVRRKKKGTSQSVWFDTGIRHGAHQHKDDHDVIHDNNSSDLALSSSLNDLDFPTLNTNGQSTEVEAPPDIIPIDDNDDFINDEDDVPHDLADSDDEFLANVDDFNEAATMSAAVARSHGGDGGGDDPYHPPPHLISSSCRIQADENHEYPALISSFYDMHTHKGVWAEESGRLQYNNIRNPSIPVHLPKKRLKIEEMLYKFINEGKREHKEMEAFIRELRTTNEILFKERYNLLSELRIEVHGLLKVNDNAQIPRNEIKGVRTRGEKMTTEGVHNDKINNDAKEPPTLQHDKPVEPNDVLVENEPQKIKEQDVQPSVGLQTPSIPFPHMLRKEKEEAQQKNSWKNLKQLHIDISFIEALAQMPKYTKFMKGLLTNKSKLEEACTVTMNERCSAVLLNKLPSKEKDPGSFTIPCHIGNLHINNALADLGVRRPFLAIAHAMIDVFNKKITLMVGDGEVVFDVDQSINRPPTDDGECYRVDDLDNTISMETQELLENDQSDLFLLKDLKKSINHSDLESCNSIGIEVDSYVKMSIRCIDSVNTPYSGTQRTKEFDEIKNEHLCSASANKIDEKKPELKDLPSHLEYAFYIATNLFL